MDELKEISKVEKLQKRDSKGKYKQILREGDVEVHEYVSPIDSGYQIIMHKVEGEKKFTKSKGYGPEAESRTWDWLEVTE